MTLAPLYDPQDGSENSPTVIVEDDAILIVGFRETDHRVREAVSASGSPEDALRRILRLGALCLDDTRTFQQTRAVAAEVDRLRSEIGASVAAGTEAIAATASALVGETGALPAAFAGFRDELGDLLEGVFDPNSKVSLLAKVDQLIAGHQEQMRAALNTQLDLGQPDSPLARSREAILTKVKEQGEKVIERLEELSKDLAVKKARSEEGERGTRKGRAYEEIVYAAVQARVNTLGDVAEHVGDATGAVPGSKVGDVVVNVNPDDASGRSVRWVAECKDKHVPSLPKILNELDDALRNREALVAVAVFSCQRNAPTQTALETFAGGTKLIVVAEKDEEGDLTTDGMLALRLACAWARLMALRALRTGEESEAIDLEAIDEAIARARMGLGSAKAVRSAHSKARKGIEEAGEQLGMLCGAIEEALAAIEGQLRSAAGGAE